jgi:hypothetical protein
MREPCELCRNAEGIMFGEDHDGLCGTLWLCDDCYDAWTILGSSAIVYFPEDSSAV